MVRKTSLWMNCLEGMFFFNTLNTRLLGFEHVKELYIGDEQVY